MVLGQCSDLMVNTLRSKDRWGLINYQQDVIVLLKEIKSITYNFEDQKYLPLSIYNAKSSFYSFRQVKLKKCRILPKNPEFSCWKWQNHDLLVEDIVPFKRQVYSKILDEFANIFQ